MFQNMFNKLLITTSDNRGFNKHKILTEILGQMCFQQPNGKRGLDEVAKWFKHEILNRIQNTD